MVEKPTMNRSCTSNSNPIQNLNSVNMEVVNDREGIGDDFQNLDVTLLLSNKKRRRVEDVLGGLDNEEDVDKVQDSFEGNLKNLKEASSSFQTCLDR